METKENQNNLNSFLGRNSASSKKRNYDKISAQQIEISAKSESVEEKVNLEIESFSKSVMDKMNLSQKLLEIAEENANLEMPENELSSIHQSSISS